MHIGYSSEECRIHGLTAFIILIVDGFKVKICAKCKKEKAS